MSDQSPVDSGQYFLTPGHLKMFTRALVHALYDRNLEEQRAIRYYYDADIVVRMVFGLYGDLQKKRNAKEDLIRALLSAGFLGQVHILRSHALELLNSVSNQEKSARIRRLGDDDSFRERIVQYFGKTTNILSRLEALRARLSRAKSEDERLNAFIAEVKASGPETFIAYELARGNWQERLATLESKVLQFEHFGEDIERILDEYPEVWALHEAIARTHEEQLSSGAVKNKPKPTSMNDLSDAVALTTLHRLIEASEVEPSRPEVRFHTNTARLERAITSTPELAAMFTYKLSTEWDMEKAWGADQVFRSTEYYILRASFQALHFGGSHLADDEENVTLADLKRVERDLTEAWRRYGEPTGSVDFEKQLLAQVEGIKIGTMTLREVVNDLERASFLAGLLQNYKPPKSLKNLLFELSVTDVFSAAETEAAISSLQEDAKRLANHLTSKLTSIQKWFDLTRLISTAVTRLSKRTNNFEIGDPIRDLGLVRWGGNPEKDDVDAIVKRARDLFSHTEGRATSAASELSRETERPPRGESRALSNGALFWMLGLFDAVTRLINRYEDRHKELPLSLQIMRKAARLRSKDSFSTTEISGDLDDLLAEVLLVEDPSIRGRHFIGLAYIAFYVTFSEGNDRIEVVCDDRTERDPVVTAWAERSFDLAERAITILEHDPLARAFAMNHAAYVGVLYKLHPDRTNRYLETLHQFRDAPHDPSTHRAWHYRFADTIAIAAYRTGYEAWMSSMGDGVRDAERRTDLVSEACAHLATAEDFLLSARPFFGDPEIPIHLREIQRLQKHIGCAPVPSA